MSCIVYAAMKMTGRDKVEQVKRSHHISNTGKRLGITVISPVIEENVKATPGKLTNKDKPRLKTFWERDKDIIRYEAHVVLLDHAEMKSFGMEREYMLNRGVLWKPTVMVVKPGTSISVAEFEDDAVFYSVEEAFKFINQKWGTRWKRWKWRSKMINRSLPKFLKDQLYAWR